MRALSGMAAAIILLVALELLISQASSVAAVADTPVVSALRGNVTDDQASFCQLCVFPRRLPLLSCGPEHLYALTPRRMSALSI